MHLALEMHRTVGELDATLDAREYLLWQKYTARFMLPMRRLELYLGQVAQAMGGGKLRDWLFDQAATTLEDEIGFNPINKGKKG